MLAPALVVAVAGLQDPGVSGRVAGQGGVAGAKAVVVGVVPAEDAVAVAVGVRRVDQEGEVVVLGELGAGAGETGGGSLDERGGEGDATIAVGVVNRTDIWAEWIVCRTQGLPLFFIARAR